jgi:superfamily I DNA/RNA helicase
VASGFAVAGVSALDITKHGAIEQGIALVSAEAAKGLEFDAVVVVEPSAIVASGLRIDHTPGTTTTPGSAPESRSEAQGYRILFVALTRATQHVSIVHNQALPLELRSAEAAPVPQTV